MTKEHYENHPNDRPLRPLEKKLMSKLGKLRHRLKINGILFSLRIRVLRTQIKSDQEIKSVFIDMFPNEYRAALAESIKKYGATKRKEYRRLEIIKDMNLKDVNVIKNEMSKWKRTSDDTAV